MMMALHKGHSVATAGLAAIAGAGVALGFTVFDSTTSLTSTSLAIASLVMVCLSVVNLLTLKRIEESASVHLGLWRLGRGTVPVCQKYRRHRWTRQVGVGLSV